MKAVIISDIHGNLNYMKKLDNYLDKSIINYLIILGDLGSNEEVYNILNKYKDIIVCVRGNCDISNDYLIFDNSSQLKEIVLDKHKFYITHGHLLPYFYDYIKNDLVFQGHTHIYNLEGQYINPGSIGEPRNYKEHTFILYKDGLLSLIDLDNYEVLQERQL